MSQVLELSAYAAKRTSGGADAWAETVFAHPRILPRLEPRIRAIFRGWSHASAHAQDHPSEEPGDYEGSVKSFDREHNKVKHEGHAHTSAICVVIF